MGFVYHQVRQAGVAVGQHAAELRRPTRIIHQRKTDHRAVLLGQQIVGIRGLDGLADKFIPPRGNTEKLRLQVDQRLIQLTVQCHDGRDVPFPGRADRDLGHAYSPNPIKQNGGRTCPPLSHLISWMV